MPKSASAISERPEPSSPVIPRISPAFTSKLMFLNCPRADSESTVNTLGEPFGTSGARRSSVISLPVIAIEMARRSKSFILPSAATAPLRRMVMVWAISWTSSSLWLTKTVATPRSFRLWTTPKRWSISLRVRAVVASSMNKSLTPWFIARAMATSCLEDTGIDCTVASRSMSTPIRSRASAAISRFRLGLLKRRFSSTEVEREMFSATDRFGIREKS